MFGIACSKVRATTARLPNGRLFTVPNAAHAAHYSHPEAVASAVVRFLGVP